MAKKKPDTKVYFHDKDGELLPGAKPAKQSFKEQCDINRILDQAMHTGVLSHVSKYRQQYGDFTGFDYEQAMNQIAEANSMFYDLPSTVREDFGNKPGNFLAFCEGKTADEIAEALPALAEPGRQLPDVHNIAHLANNTPDPAVEPAAAEPPSEPAPEGTVT